MAMLSRGPRSLLFLLGAVAGILCTAWGLWALYVGIANVDPGSEIPRWLAFVFAVTLLQPVSARLEETQRTHPHH